MFANPYTKIKGTRREQNFVQLFFDIFILFLWHSLRIRKFSYSFVPSSPFPLLSPRPLIPFPSCPPFHPFSSNDIFPELLERYRKVLRRKGERKERREHCEGSISSSVSSHLTTTHAFCRPRRFNEQGSRILSYS